MVEDHIHQTVGRIEGKLDTLTAAMQSYQLAHTAKHAVIDTHLDEIKADINMAKGAKGAILAMVATLSAIVSAAIASAVKWIK